ncbi:MAG: Hsp20/alpha crystallin family protein [Acidobacteria bacterium]|nr:MAG: Hsp20/alpha crystallin family protein [Acidobacteriota bacterium]REK04216.1 MAG: Hsp20/alpha crystallin family protein [Acidobacteriota bacterium]REK15477.1 MAG: Hsp20/alpha crystallin family protein [Acidobacteriota bacterium]REK46468.1 MAG: Hsp20/alpha crystallin family protein [Acidobacteriota bacterium]
MNRLFMTNVPRSVAQEDLATGGWSPNVDIYESENEIILEAELPGMNREDFEVSIENNVITLKGKREFEKKEEGDNYHRVERSYGAFTRSFSLPRTVSAEHTTADFRNGVLKVSLPKREEAKSRRIEVTGESEDGQAIDTEARTDSANA